MKYLLTLITLLFIGCGDAPESATTTPITTASSSTIDMVLNKSYPVYTGDRIDNASSDAELKIVTVIEGEEKEATLIMGSAQLIRSN